MENKSHIGYLINVISNKLKRSADENLTHENMTIEQLQVLKLIHQSGGVISQKEIEKAFGVRRSTVTSAMQILEKKGFIERKAHPDDMRAKLVALTDAGIAKNSKLINFIKVRDERLLSVLDEEEKETLMKLLSKLLDNID